MRSRVIGLWCVPRLDRPISPHPAAHTKKSRRYKITDAIRKASNRGDYQKASVMKRRERRQRLSLAGMMSDLMLASLETITRRSLSILQNDCSPAEYRRMANEKAEAAARSAARLVSGGGRATMTSLLAPWHSRAIANARHLRRSGRIRAVPPPSSDPSRAGN
jgi:hypothetical protein